MTDDQINYAIAEECCTQDALINYAGDLNAIQSAVDTLDIRRKVNFVCCLESMLCGPCDTKVRVCLATARQRSEAFLRTIGKWKDRKP